MIPPVDVLTGFLGSGKTTLLRHAISQGFDEKRVAIVMNEIGTIGLDGKVITGLDFVEQMVELSGGCVCCSIPQYQFAVAMQELVEKARPHLIVMETTGIADPFELVARLHDLRYPVDAVITVVDTANFDRTVRAEPVGREQVAAADFLVLNKCDLVDASQLARVERRLSRLNSRAISNRAIQGRIDHHLLFGVGGNFWRRRVQESPRHDRKNHDHLGIQAFVWTTDHPMRRSRFEKVMQKLPEQVYRAKGLVTFIDHQRVYSFNYVAGRMEIGFQPLEGFTGAQGIFIGRGINQKKARITRWLEKCVEQG